MNEGVIPLLGDDLNLPQSWPAFKAGRGTHRRGGTRLRRRGGLPLPLRLRARRVLPSADSSRSPGKERLPNQLLSWRSTTPQGSSQCLSVMVTITVRPRLRYSPLTIWCEKYPERSSPRSVAPFSLTVLLALASIQEGLAALSMLNVLAMLTFLPPWGGRLNIYSTTYWVSKVVSPWVAITSAG
jgi:hypothetical protein